MAIIKPSDIDLGHVQKHSQAEWKILKDFIDLDKEKTKDWVVYYSFAFKRGNYDRSNEGTVIKHNNEIDFLILIPNKGIVVFEIKGGQIITKNNTLYSIDKKGIEHEINPFKQANDNFYGLNNRLEAINCSDGRRELKEFVFSTVVGFPDISEIPDCGVGSNNFDIYVQGMKLYDFLLGSISKICNDNRRVPSKEDIKYIEEKLKGKDFVYSLSKGQYIKSINLKLNQLTEEQTTVFSGLLENKRCLIKGAAGTGKTVLCQFLYKYLVNEKKCSVIYFTFNKLIAERINIDIESDGSSGCYPIFEYLENLYNQYIKKPLPEKFNDKKKMLLDNASTILEKNINARKYDCLIIDEAQDIGDSDEVFMFLDSLLNKGLKNGMCYMFFDTNQKIFDNSERKIYSNYYFGEDEYRYANFTLTRNCRNGENIQRSLIPFIEKDKNASDMISIRKQLTNSDVNVEETTKQKCADKIVGIINELKSQESIKAEQITILFNSGINEKNSVLNELKKTFGSYISAYSPSTVKGITYSNVYSYKGLENDVIIYVNDFENADAGNHYVAISRAKVLSYVLVIR